MGDNMSASKLREQLDQLQREISQLDVSDDEEKQRLQQLIADIQAASDADEAEAGLHGSLSDAVTHFEARYPRLTAIMNDIMVTLSNMGI